MKHTPGPWHFSKVHNFTGTHVSYIKSDKKQLAQTRTDDYNSTEQETLANASLIAAAPDLLEACQYVVRWHREHDSGEGELYGLDFVTTCIGAITKATKE